MTTDNGSGGPFADLPRENVNLPPLIELSAPFPAKAVEQRQLSESVAAYLREQILSGQLRNGEFLRIDALAKTLGVSTTPVREGLLLLQSESFVRLLPRRGFVVNAFTKEDLYDLFWAQAAVGAELAARAAKRMSKEDLEELRKVDAEYDRAAATGDATLRDRMGHQFHRAINLAAQSPRLALLMGNLARQLPGRFYANIEGHLEDTLKYHPIILDAMRVKDADAVRSLMYRHIMSAGEQLIASLERQGMWDPPAFNASKTFPDSPGPIEPQARRAAAAPRQSATTERSGKQSAGKHGAAVKTVDRKRSR